MPALFGSRIKQARTELKILDALTETLNGFAWSVLREKAIVSKAIMSETVKRLEESGFIEKREQRYVITKKGEERRQILRIQLGGSNPNKNDMVIFNGSLPSASSGLSSGKEVNVIFSGSARIGGAESVNRSRLEAELKKHSEQLHKSLRGVTDFETATIIISIKKVKEVPQ